MAPPKKLRPTVTQADLSAYLALQDDFALELFTTSEARKAGLEVVHGGTYEDSVTGKHRQFDVRAFYVNENREICLAVECKALRANYPLLVSRIARTESESAHDVVYTYRQSSFLDGYVPGQCITVAPSPKLYPTGSPVGKSMTQVGLNADGDFVASDSDTYDKWNQALSSLAGLVARGWKGHERTTRRNFLSASIPVLVVSDDTLWVADYSADGIQQGHPRNEAQVEHYVGRDYLGPGQHKFTATHLHIVTKSALPVFLNRIPTDEFLSRVFPANHMPSELGA